MLAAPLGRAANCAKANFKWCDRQALESMPDKACTLVCQQAPGPKLLSSWQRAAFNTPLGVSGLFFAVVRVRPSGESATLRKTLAFFTQERLVAVTKTEVVSVRVPPDVKAALIAAAEHERRSLASMVEFMVLQYCKGQGIVVSPGIQSVKTRRRD